jgi:hypothetical protein
VTIAELLDLHATAVGGLSGRVMSEALPNGITPKVADGMLKSKPDANGLMTVVKWQRVVSHSYFDAAGFPGRTFGLEDKQKTAGK